MDGPQDPQHHLEANKQKILTLMRDPRYRYTLGFYPDRVGTEYGSNQLPDLSWKIKTLRIHPGGTLATSHWRLSLITADGKRTFFNNNVEYLLHGYGQMRVGPGKENNQGVTFDLELALKHLLRANHVNHSIIYHNLQFDNHLPHILCSAYLLGADVDQLHHIYDVEAKQLDPWVDSPAEVTEHDWRDFLGDKRYQRAYVDFFEDRTSSHAVAYDWKKVVDRFMFRGDEPLVNGLIGGLGHPLIHLGYAYEFDSREIAMEALALAAVQYNFLHKYLDDKSHTRPSPIGSASPSELLDRLADDKRFDGLFGEPGFDNIEPLFEKHEDLVLEYWNAWKPDHDDPVKQFRESQEAAVALLVATVPPGTHAYNFFVCHTLTTSHAVRILLPLIPARFHVSLVRQWWLLVLAVYVAELRPKIDPDYVTPDLGGKGWKYVEDRALRSDWATDAHYVKAIRAMREAARTWGDVHERYLASAVRFVDDFNGWTF